MNENFKRILASVGAMIITSAITVFVMAMNTSGQIKDFEALRKRCTELTTGIVTDVDEESHLSVGKFRTKYYVYRNEYTYTVGDQNIVSVFMSREDTRSKLRDSINVFYDPDDPLSSYTYYDKPKKDRFDVAESYVLSALMIAAGVFLIFWPRGVFKRFRRREELYVPVEEEMTDQNEEDSE